MTSKTLWHIKLNWHGEVHEFYRHAKSKKGAVNTGVTALAKEVGYIRQFVTHYIHKSGTDRWSVSPVVNK